MHPHCPERGALPTALHPTNNNLGCPLDTANLTSAFRTDRASTSWIEALKELIHQTPEKLSLKILSEQLGVHPVHLSRAIPKYLSVNLGEYLRQDKVKQSISFLIDNSYSLTEIAFKSGFSDQSHFTRTFKFYFGMTPKVFKKQLLA